jgi:hypothetical protein
MAFVIRFATHTVEIWLKQQSPLRWGSLEDAHRYRTAADAHRAVASLWLRGVTIQDLGQLGHVVRLPMAPVRLRNDEAARRFSALTQHGSLELKSVHRHPGNGAAPTSGGRSAEITLARHADAEDLVTALE